MKKEYIFNIGIVSPEKKFTEKTEFFNFVLNTRSNLEMKPQNDNKSYEENKSELYELINEVVRRYAVMKNKNESKLSTDEEILKQNTSYSNFLKKAPNQTTQKKMINENVTQKDNTQKNKYKLGIICNGYYNNRLLEIEDKKTGIINDFYKNFASLRLFTLISQKLCLLGYHVECVAYNIDKDGKEYLYKNGTPIVITHEINSVPQQKVKVPIADLKFDFINENQNLIYKKIANADKYYYKIDIANYKTFKLKEKNIDSFETIYGQLLKTSTPLFFINKEKTTFYILSVHDLLKYLQDSKNSKELDLNKVFVDFEKFVQTYEQNVNEYIECVFLTYLKQEPEKINLKQ